MNSRKHGIPRTHLVKNLDGENREVYAAFPSMSRTFLLENVDVLLVAHDSS